MTKQTRTSGKSTASLEWRLASYAMAGGALLAAAETADASIIYSGPQNIPIDSLNTPFNLDLNNDAIVDYQFNNEFFTTGTKDWRELRVLTTPTLGITNQVADSAVPLSSGVELPGSPGSHTFGDGDYQMAGYKDWPFTPFSGPYGAWDGVSNQYLGLAFDIGGDTHYGWAQLSVPQSTSISDGGTAILHDWAYESVANAPIVTGATISAASTVPEPASLALLAVGAAGVGAYLAVRRRKSTSDVPSSE